MIAALSAARTQADPSLTPARPDSREAVGVYLRHIYAIYLGVRACSELSTELKDRAYEASVTYDEARGTMRRIDSAAAEVGVKTDAVWASAVPKALITAEALKRSPRRLAVCQRIGGIFRDDEANLQNLLGRLGARQTIIPKDF